MHAERLACGSESLAAVIIRGYYRQGSERV